MLSPHPQVLGLRSQHMKGGLGDTVQPVASRIWAQGRQLHLPSRRRVRWASVPLRGGRSPSHGPGTASGSVIATDANRGAEEKLPEKRPLSCPPVKQEGGAGVGGRQSLSRPRGCPFPDTCPCLPHSLQLQPSRPTLPLQHGALQAVWAQERRRLPQLPPQHGRPPLPLLQGRLLP